MIINRDIIKNDDNYAYLRKEPGLIFDIETTGFSAKTASVYLIGMIYYSNDEDSLVLEQWFAGKETDEYELLYKFSNFLETFETVYHYNGDTFDLPFLRKRMALYKLTMPQIESIDYLKAFRPFKKFLDLPNLKLKTIEEYFGYDRTDPFTGKDLIEIYKQFLSRQDTHLLKALLLHNYEDLLGLKIVINQGPMLTLLNNMLNGELPIQLQVSMIENGYYLASFTIDYPGEIYQKNELFEMTLKDGQSNITIPTEARIMKLYLEPISDYYYLPAEDYAVHKSIGKFVQKEHRVKATRENCYVKKDDFFLPAYKRFKLPVHLYYNKYNDALGYVSVSDLVESNQFENYLSHLLKLAF